MDRVVEIEKEIKKCRELIEKKLDWVDSSKWTRREYELLIETIFNKTGTLLSLSTIRRIWNDEYKNIPHKSTLDALAITAGFLSWQNFIELTRLKHPHIQETKKNKSKNYIGAAISLLIIVISSTLYFQIFNSKTKVKITGDLKFEYSHRVESIIPNVVIFEYDVENIEADSFFIVESTHNYKKKPLKQTKGQLTSVYYHPGNYVAFLMANDSVLKKLNIEILSNDWVCMVNYRKLNHKIPFYFYKEDLIDNGKLSISRNMLINSNIRIEDDLNTTFTSTFKSETPIYRDYIFSSRIKLDSIEINSSCPGLYLGLLFEDDLCYLPLIQNGGQDKLQLKFGNTVLSSNDSDLSGLGCNIYEWQDIKVVSSQNDIKVYLNDKQTLIISDSSNMGQFKGFRFNFDGIGSIDYISLSTSSEDSIYYSSFQ